MSHRTDSETTELLQLNKKINEVKGKTKENIEKVLERGDNVKELDTTAEDVSEKAKIFDKEAKAVKRAECLQKFKYQIILTTIVVVIILVVAVILIGVLLYFFKR